MDRFVIGMGAPFGRVLSMALLLLALGGLAACGGESTPSCDGVECDFGTCEAGVCANPSACDQDLDCIPGSLCAPNGVCRALQSCSNDSNCGTGVCQNGSCVNPNACQSDDDCFERTFCGDDGTCQPDPCNTSACDRGTCERGTGECVSKETCTVETELEDCLDGEQCYDGTCHDQESYCGEFDCESGVCSFIDRACVNADDCKGEDGRCLDGYYCNSDNECAEDLCEVNEVECTNGGVCVPSLGECQNASSCSSQDDCIEDHVCVDSQCRLETLACGDDGCPGNQVCDYDADALSATCKENTRVSCNTSLDCVDERRCAGERCVEPTACQNDGLEPNNSADQAFELELGVTGFSAQGAICSGDVDFYSFDLGSYPDVILRGRMVVTVEYVTRDIGLGELELEVLDEEGNVVGTDTAGNMGVDGILEVRENLSAASPRAYTVRVADTGDVTTEGVYYTVSAHYVDFDTANACENAEILSTIQPARGNTNASASSGLGSSCTSLQNNSPEDIYTFSVVRSSVITLEAKPQDEESQSDFALSLRRSCLRADTEVACGDETERGAETLTTVVDPGTYFVAVQAGRGGSGGEYELSLDVDRASCSQADNVCISDSNAAVCVPSGQRLQTESCQSTCDPRTGTCVRPAGDECANPFELSDGDVETITWNNFKDDYQVGSDSCRIGGTGSQTDGPDTVYAVELESNHAMRAELDMPSGERGSLYLLTSCISPSSSCVSGATGEESLTYHNSTGSTQTLLLVADSDSSSSLTQATLSVEIGRRICQPERRTCDSNDDVQKCNDIGTEYNLYEACYFGCSSSICDTPPNQTCEGALALTNGQSMTIPIEDYTNDFQYTPGASGCTGDAEAGADAVFTVTTTQPGQLVEVEVDAPWQTSITAARHCHRAEALCSEAADQFGNPQVLEFTAREAGEYFIIVDTDDTNAAGDFTITATVQSPVCAPGSITGCSGSAVEYCDASGTTQTSTCSGTCANGACDTPSGDVCADPVVLADGDSITDSLGGSNSIQFPGRRFGGCLLDTGDDTRGAENIYRVDLLAGDLLEADLSASGDTFMFIVEDCFFADETCTTNSTGGGSATRHYFAETDTSVFIVVDSNVSSSTSQYTLSVDVTTGAACAPGETSCVSANSVQKCSADGTQVLNSYTCAGGCAAGKCFTDIENADTCNNAPNIGTGISTYANRAMLTNDVLIYSYSSCVNSYGYGRDLVYEVDMAADEVLLVNAESHSQEQPMVYVVTDCSSPHYACLDGVEASSDYTADLHYQSPTNQKVWVVIDSSSSTDDGYVSVDIDKIPPNCTDSSPTSCIDSQTVETCKEGFYTSKTCYYGNGCTGGACEPPTNDACSGATNVPVDGSTYTFNGYYDDFTSDYDVYNSSCTSYTWNRSGGPDAVWSVDALAGDVIDVSLTGGHYPTLYISSDCPSVTNNCVAGKRQTSDGTIDLMYVVPTDGTYYIVADSDTGTRSDVEEFQVDIKASVPDCQRGVDPASCADSNTLEYCGEYGTWVNYSCAGGCTNGACGSPTGDFCADAIVMGDGDSDVDDYSGTNDVDPVAAGQKGSCTMTNSSGTDHIYAVDLLAGETLTASYSPSSKSTSCCGFMYIMTDCWDTSTCQSNTGQGSSGTLTYTASSDETVYVVQDRGISGSTSLYGYTMNISISP